MAAYRAGIARGKALAKAARHRQAVAAGKKSGEARRTKAKAPKPPAEVVAVGVLTFYDDTTKGLAILSGLRLDTFMHPAAWLATVELLDTATGEQLIEETLRINAQPMWDDEMVQRTLRREIRAWYDGVRGQHPGWFGEGDSPVADLFRLELTRT